MRFGFRLSLVDLNIANLAWSKWLFGARCAVRALSVHTGSRMLVNWLTCGSCEYRAIHWTNENNFFPALRQNRGVDLDIVTYQQNGATPHCSNALLECLHRYFPGGRLIACRKDHLWPAQCPDLSSLDYFLWEYLKGRIYSDNHQTTDALKNKMLTEIIKRIRHEIFDRIITTFNVRVVTMI